MLNINDEITALEVKIDILKEDGKFEAAKIACFQAAKLGSGNICMLLATAYHPGGKIFPEQFQAMFIKNRRRANRFCNRELRCLRKSAKKGNYFAMFSLYNAHCFGHPRLMRKSRFLRAELWLRKAAESGHEIPINELRMFLDSKNIEA